MGRPSYRGEYCRIRCLRGKAYSKEGAEIGKSQCVEITIKQKELNALFPAKNDWGILLGTQQEKQNENIMIAASPFLLFRPEALHGAITGTLRRKGSLWPSRASRTRREQPHGGLSASPTVKLVVATVRSEPTSHGTTI